jgi:hypothetical protein
MATVVWKGNPALFTAGVNTVLVEQPESPAYEFSKDGPKCTRTFRGLHSLCLDSGLAPGTVGTGDMSGWLVTKCSVKRLPRQIGELVIEYGATAAGGAGGLAVLPVDEYDLQPFEAPRALESHPRYSGLDETVQAKVRDWVNCQDPDGRTTRKALLTGNALALELGNFLLKGVSEFYFAGWTYTWTTYSWTLPDTIDNGGYIAAPGGPLASLLAANTAVVWLRQCDHMEWTGTSYKLTRTWLGASDGRWAPEIYS